MKGPGVQTAAVFAVTPRMDPGGRYRNRASDERAEPRRGLIHSGMGRRPAGKGAMPLSLTP
jgi:hypothetical protein